MDSKDTGASTTEPARGIEIDVRPHPGRMDGAETQVLRSPVRSHRQGAPEEDVHAEWPEGHVTGAFVSRAASLRHSVQPYSWRDRFSLGMLALWGGFVGLPAAGGAWAAWEIWHRVH